MYVNKILSYTTKIDKISMKQLSDVLAFWQHGHKNGMQDFVFFFWMKLMVSTRREVSFWQHMKPQNEVFEVKNMVTMRQTTSVREAEELAGVDEC